MSLAEALARIDESPEGPQVGAFFDFDGTVIDGYSAVAFYRHRARRLEIGPLEAAQLLLIGLRGVGDEVDFGRFLTLGFAAWAGRSEDELTELGERLFRQSIARAMFPEAWQLVRAHQRKGHTVVLASSATRFQVGPAARELGVDDVLCTEVEVTDGLLTGRTAGDPLWRNGKAAAVTGFAKRRKIALTKSFAYSNGDEDVAFLAAAGHPTAVNPQRGLAAEARARDWPVLRFGSRGMPDLGRTVRSLATYGLTLGGFTGGIALGLLNGNRDAAVGMAATLGSELGLAAAGIDLRVTGEEHLWSHRPAVFLFNHQSQLDLLVVCRLLRRGFTGVAKRSVANDPLFGPFLRFAQVAFVERGNTAQAIAALEPAVQKLKDGTSLVVAPEGTRSPTPAVREFRKGAFHVAMQAGVPVVPIVIRNSGELMAPDAITLGSGTLDVAVLPPISTARWTVPGLDRQVAKVRQRFVDTLDHWPSATDETYGGTTSGTRP